MTPEEYTAFQAAFNEFMTREGIHSLSPISDVNSGEWDTSFSWYRCDCCRSTLGGDRHKCESYVAETKSVETFSVCTDCVYYAAYGYLES